MMIFAFLYFSRCAEFSTPIEVGRNSISIDIDKPFIATNINPQSFFIFVHPIPDNVKISAKDNELKPLGEIDHSTVGFHFGLNSGSLRIEILGEEKTATVDFFYLEPPKPSREYFISSYPNDAFVISNSKSFYSCKDYNGDHTISYWHVTGQLQQLTTAFQNQNPENLANFSYENNLKQTLTSKSNEQVTLSFRQFLYFTWNSVIFNKKNSYKLIIRPGTSNLDKSFNVPPTRYKFTDKSKTSIIKINHNYGQYSKLINKKQKIPMGDFLSDNSDAKESNIIRFSFEPSALNLIISLMGIIVVLLIVLIYVGLMPLSPKNRHRSSNIYNDEESLLKNRDRNGDLETFLK